MMMAMMGVSGCGEGRNFFPQTNILLSDSMEGTELPRLSKLAEKWGFLPAPIGPRFYNAREGRAESLRTYEHRERHSLFLSFSYLSNNKNYIIVVGDFDSPGLYLTGKGCQKYLEVLSDLRATFGPDRLIIGRKTCQV
jgi:hypothetical protein